MVIEAISGLNLDFFDKIYFIALQEHEEKYQFSKGFAKELEQLGVAEISQHCFISSMLHREIMVRALPQLYLFGMTFVTCINPNMRYVYFF